MSARSRRSFFKTGASAGASLIALSAESQHADSSRPRLKLAFAEYLRLTPLVQGDVRPKSFELEWVRGPRAEMLRRALGEPGFDGGEASMLQHLLRIDAGDRSLVAVPVFPLRNFTARDLYVRKGSRLTPTALAGQRVGIYSWAASGAVWYRHFLRHVGQDPARIRWVVGGVDEATPVASRAPLPPHVTNAPEGRSLSELLLAGELDAVFAPLPPRHHHPLDGPIVRLIADFRAVERRYFADTRCYPPQHVLVVRRETWRKHAGLGRALLETFQECETRFQQAHQLFPYDSPWLIAEVEETALAMGKDYHAHGLDKNRHALDVFCEGAFADGLTKRRVTVDDYFAEFLGA
jgi:4,5-dihydroxyphthalate decarboxylase